MATRSCRACGKAIGNRTILNGREINTQRRKYCLDCSPFGSGNGEKPNRPNRGRQKPPQSKQRELRRERKRRLIEMLGGRCVRCGYDKCLRALELHHTVPSNKKFTLASKNYTSRWDVLVEEALKCQVLCANCHREVEEFAILA